MGKEPSERLAMFYRGTTNVGSSNLIKGKIRTPILVGYVSEAVPNFFVQIVSFRVRVTIVR